MDEVTADRWWEDVPVHPCADLFPMMTNGELDQLANDITQNGLQEPIVMIQVPVDRFCSMAAIDGQPPNMLRQVEADGASSETIEQALTHIDADWHASRP